MASFELRYARAFVEATAGKNLDRGVLRQGLEDFSSAMQTSHDLREFLTNPSLPHTEKLNVLTAVAEKLGLPEVARNFLAVLMDHGRLKGLDDVIAEYVAMADAAAGVTEAEITSARDLNDADKQALAASAAKLAGGDVRVVWKQDAALLGGAVVKLGSTVYDGSLRAQLAGMERHLAGTR